MRILIPFAIGVAAGETDAVPVGMAPVFFIAAALLLIAYFILISRKGVRRNSRGRTVAATTLFFCVILMGCGADLASRNGETARWPVREREWRGVVMEQPRSTRRTWALTLRLDSSGHGRKVIISLLKAKTDKPPRVGDAVSFSAIIVRPHNFALNPGNTATKRNGQSVRPFNYARYLYRHGYTGMAIAYENTQTLPPATADSLISRLPWSKRMTVKANILRAGLVTRYSITGLQDDDAAVLSALTLGERSGVSRNTRDVFSQTGASHILALSGLHLGILVSILMLVLRPMRLSRQSQWAAVAVSIVLVWAFVVLTGGSVSIVRSALMLTLMLLLSMRGEGFASIGNVVMAALLILICAPRSLMDVGFQLSFLSVFFILYFLPYYQEWADRIPYGLWRRVADFVFISVVAQAATAPVVASVFGRLPLYFLLTNIIVIPSAYLLLGGAVVFFALGWWSAAGMVIARFLGSVTKFMTGALEWIASLPLAGIEVCLPSLACWALYPLMFTLFALFAFRRSRYLLWSALFFGIFLTALIWG